MSRPRINGDEALVYSIIFVPLIVCILLLLTACAYNGNGLIPNHQEIRGCIKYHEPGKPDREECT